MKTAVFLISSYLLLHAACNANAQFDLEVAFPHLSFDRPVDLQHPGDGSGRLFVVEQPGRIKVFRNDRDTRAAATFLDLGDRVLYGGEQGLLGLAFHPAFESNGFFFVNYTAASPRRTVVARYRVDPASPDRADPGSAAVILEVEQPYSNHNGGQIGFGPDGYLYIALGDGGSGGDPQENGEDPSTLLGAILRIDVDRPAGNRAYGIPPDNPFAGNTQGFRQEIFAYGLRNPWRFSFDPATGRLWTADVGQNRYEEIHVVTPGGHHGWDILEGRHCYEPTTNCQADGLVAPVWEYPHAQGSSVTGGFVYRGRNVPELTGRYVYGDYVSGRIWALTLDGDEAVENVELLRAGTGTVSSFGLDADGELYVCNHRDGRIYRLVPTAGTSGQRGDAPGGTSRLEAPFPNPFRAAVQLPYTLARGAHVDLGIYDVLGRRLRTLARRLHPSGAHAVTWDGRDDRGAPVAEGLYYGILRLDAALAGTRHLVRLR